MMLENTLTLSLKTINALCCLSLQPNLYPTVGLQTPGEVVDANFGQEPFVFDIEDMMKELRSRTRMSIYDFPVPSQGEWQAILNK